MMVQYQSLYVKEVEEMITLLMEKDYSFLVNIEEDHEFVTNSPLSTALSLLYKFQNRVSKPRHIKDTFLSNL